MNICMDRHHPFHTYNDHKWFRQFEFTQHNIVINIDDMERDTEILNGTGSLRHWRCGYNQFFSVIFYILMAGYSCSTSKLTCFWAIFHCLPLFRQTPVWLGRSSKNMDINEPESWNHFAIDSLNHWLWEQSAAIIASLKKKFKERRNWLKTILSLYSVQSVSGFQRHLHGIVGKTTDFSDLKTNTIDTQWANWRGMHANRKLDLFTV